MIPVLWLCGPPGVGKTAVAWEIHRRLQRDGHDGIAYVDVDQLGMCFPERATDPGRHALKARNVAALRGSYALAGACGLIVSGVADPTRGPDTDGIGGGEIAVCRLRAEPAELVARLGARRGSPAGADAAALEREARALDESRFTEWSVDTTNRSVAAVADHVLAALGQWPGTAACADVRRGTVAAHAADGQPDGGDVLWLCGPRGVGKSTVGFRLYLDVLQAGVGAAFVDADQVGFFGGGSTDHVLRARNVASLWRGFRAAGAEVLVVVGPIATSADARVYERALAGATFTWCRLQASDAELAARIGTRSDGGSWAQPGDPLRGRTVAELRDVVTASVADARRLEDHGFGLRIAVDGLSAEATVDHIVARTGWPPGRAAGSR
jgi:adenylylsulfate kinase-like enzyme